MLEDTNSCLFVASFPSHPVCTLEYVLLFLVVQVKGEDLTGLLLFTAILDIIAVVLGKCNSPHKMAAVPRHFPAGLRSKAS